MIEKFCNRDPLLPFLGPSAIPTDTGESLKFVTLVRANGLRDMFDIDRTVIEEIIENVASAQDNEAIMESLIRKLNKGLQKYATPHNSPPGNRHEVRSKQGMARQKLPDLLNEFKKIPNLPAKSFPGSSWVTPANPLLQEIQSQPLRTGQKIKRTIELLGLKHDDDPECRFLVQFSIDPEYHSLIRKPTMLSNGDPMVYATWRNTSSSTWEYGRTVDLNTLDIGLEEAVVPRPLVVAMANNIKVVGILLPADIIVLDAIRARADLVKNISENRKNHF
ncbi:MAG: hypothetical protein HQL89_11765 [Magnetococcales bacterium]|nr:hypothetical protein [Magnetococcales bacterium]